MVQDKNLNLKMNLKKKQLMYTIKFPFLSITL